MSVGGRGGRGEVGAERGERGREGRERDRERASETETDGAGE